MKKNLYCQSSPAVFSLIPRHTMPAQVADSRNICPAIDYPLVSVIIPAYNAEQFIAHTLESVVAQSYSNIEILVIDDGSQDKTAHIVKQYVEKDSRIILYQQKNSGVSAARNFGIWMSKGEFIAPIDADDTWHPENIMRQVNCILKADSLVGVVYTWSFDIDADNQPTGKFHASNIEGNVYLTLLCHYFLGNGSCTLIRRTCLEKDNAYSLQLKNSCEDWEFYLSIAERYEFRVVPEFLTCYRKTLNSLSQDLFSMKDSHELMIKGIQKKTKIIPFVYKISSSSFYIYLASQSCLKGDFYNSLAFVNLALKCSFLLSIIRPSIYLIMSKSIFGSVTKSYFCKTPESNSLKQKLIYSKLQPSSAKVSRSYLFPNFNPSLVTMSLKTLAESVLHKSLKTQAKKLFDSSYANKF